MFAENKKEMAEQDKLIPVTIGEQTRWLKSEMCQGFRDGLLRVVGDGATTVSEFMAFMELVYPDRKGNKPITVPEENTKYTDLPAYPISAFFAETEQVVPVQSPPVLEGKRELTYDENLNAGLLAVAYLDKDTLPSMGKSGHYLNGYCDALSSLPSREEIEGLRRDKEKLREALSQVSVCPALDEAQNIASSALESTNPNK